ncbi:hypothetical protein CAPTEDRAFT_215480 [Capitella teleta]|uniref:UPAR/Ly6 domain-containing protein n=1 Tax=Capitella teleta TaxID=283909 RepID=R7U7M8_CAPTE|nr:hypothetical protein CAPTEDRAFT_215480 [Capitella teleta]|eukprot:ELT99145.1 hypothetical protein CAPTEDRAFT_215480 [Capitella teleta]
MKTKFVAALVLIGIALCPHRSTAVRCYQPARLINNTLLWDFDPETSPTCEGPQCFYMTIIETGEIPFRGCPNWKTMNGCVDDVLEGTPVKHCFCDTDLCNGAEGPESGAKGLKIGTQTGVMFGLLLSALGSTILSQL